MRVSSFKTINKLKNGMNSKRNFHLIENEKIFIAQITSDLPSSWKQSLGNYTENINSLVI